MYKLIWPWLFLELKSLLGDEHLIENSYKQMSLQVGQRAAEVVVEVCNGDPA